jgi:hypothetical protein
MTEDDPLDEMLEDDESTDKPVETDGAAYEVIGELIPVSKSSGSLWKSRHKDALRTTQTHRDICMNVLQYYQNTLEHSRTLTGGVASGQENARRSMRRGVTYVENMIFANAQALMPHIYTQNPTVTMTTNHDSDEVSEAFALAAQMLINALVTKKGDVGLGLKTKVRRSILGAHLWNRAYIEVGYTKKQESIETARQQLQTLSNELAKAANKQELREAEAKIGALEENFDFLRSAGPWTKYRRFDEVLVDPASVEEDLSDAKWIMISDLLPTAYVQNKYGRKNSNDEYMSIFKPTHVISNDPEKDDANEELTRLTQQDTFRSMGYLDEESFVKSQYTKTWAVWDKVTRRVYLFNEDDWTWPLFVWDDPYQLDGFFPVSVLWSTIDPSRAVAKPETAYVLDQQDMIDTINSARAQIIQWATRKVVYNRNKIDKATFEKLVLGDDDKGVGVDLPDGMTIKDVIGGMIHPAAGIMELLDTGREHAAMDRVTAMSDVIRGGQFKTNTTNQAINTYADIASAKNSDRTDLIEDFISNVLWQVTQLCIQNMPQEQVQGYIGKRQAESWRNMDSATIATSVSLQVVGGTTTKPTSRNKKQEALEIAQVLGQFAQVPQVLILVIKMLRRAFNDTATITDEDWQMILEGIMTASGAGGDGASDPSDPAAGGGDAESAISAVTDLIDGLPPEVKQAIGQAIASGMPMAEVLGTLMEGDENVQQ